MEFDGTNYTVTPTSSAYCFWETSGLTDESTYAYRWYVNDSANNYNSTPQRTFTVDFGTRPSTSTGSQNIPAKTKLEIQLNPLSVVHELKPSTTYLDDIYLTSNKNTEVNLNFVCEKDREPCMWAKFVSPTGEPKRDLKVSLEANSVRTVAIRVDTPSTFSKNEYVFNISIVSLGDEKITKNIEYRLFAKKHLTIIDDALLFLHDAWDNEIRFPNKNVPAIPVRYLIISVAAVVVLVVVFFIVAKLRHTRGRKKHE